MCAFWLGFPWGKWWIFFVHTIKKHMCVVSILTLSSLWLLAVILCPFLCWGCLMYLYIVCLLCRLRCMQTMSNLSCYKISFLLWTNKKGDVIGSPKLNWECNHCCFPPSGDFSDPIIVATLSTVKVGWSNFCPPVLACNGSMSYSPNCIGHPFISVTSGQKWWN
jgi:hypothetical protein